MLLSKKFKQNTESNILKLEQDVRGWSLIVNNLKKQNAPLHVWKCAVNEVSKRVKEINGLKSNYL